MTPSDSPAPLEQFVPSNAVSQSSWSSDLTSPHPREETLVCIRENVRAHLQQVDDSHSRHEYLVQLARPLLQLPEQERWAAQVFISLTGLQEMSEGLYNRLAAMIQHGNQLSVPNPTVPNPTVPNPTVPNPTVRNPTVPIATVPVTPTAAPAEASPGWLRSFVRANIRPILLRSDLDSYGRRGGRKNRAAKTPFSLMKALIPSQDDSILRQLPSNYRNDPGWNSTFETMVTEQLKADKHKLSNILQANLPTTGTPLKPVPKLCKLVADAYSAMLPRFKDVPSPDIYQAVSKPDRARLAYLRLMMNWNRHQRQIAADPKTATFWHQVDDDLQARVGKPKTYRFAFAQLVLRKDRALWDGTRTVDDLNDADFALPTEREIAAEEDRIKGNPPTNPEDDNDDMDV
ncbi:hypothetical protein PCASD_07480 [Puccinia coronata f. sp. avenae]|uniref:Uncharacterized protein n=1 Tax=Puccinia coronata f. sp. avenae TaxID=200324 RepID=A0A2N5TGD6_9BASI|nr:hypothetical protein PCASD_07480 [Puccinia coronata f. sp. avenae]